MVAPLPRLPRRAGRGRLALAAALGFGVATQIDADEAYRPLRVLNFSSSCSAAPPVCATGLFVFSYTNFTFRRRLSEAELRLKQLGHTRSRKRSAKAAWASSIAPATPCCAATPP